MTLHWWMHWFWVTAIALSSECRAMPPESSDKYNAETKAYHDMDDSTNTESSISDYSSHDRMAKSIVFTHKSTANPIVLTKSHSFINPYPQSSDMPDVGSEFIQRETIILPTMRNLNKTNISKIVEDVHSTNVSDTNSTHDNVVNSSTKAVEKNYTSDHFTVASDAKADILQVSITNSNNETSVNSKTHNTKEPTINKPISIVNISSLADDVRDDNITEKPLSSETTIDVEHILSSLEAVGPTKGKITLAAASIEDQPADGSMDIAAVSGISFAALVLVALTGVTSFVLYRRRYLNKPQTLNDKCSNPDSSGYIDDSTIRENSEEMYSLDNDSFLNSLEAMTIQNYWTDTVKHTKL